MNIILPNGQKFSLDKEISLQEKIELVESLTEEWMSLIIRNWNNDSVKYFLDSLANYLVWHKESEQSEHEEDKEVMSKNKTNRMYRGRKDIPFSSLDDSNKELLLGEPRGNQDE